MFHYYPWVWRQYYNCTKFFPKENALFFLFFSSLCPQVILWKSLSWIWVKHTLWVHFQQTVICKTLISVCRCMDKQMGLFTTALGTHTTVILLLQNLSCICSRGKIRNKKLRKIPNLLSKISSHGVTLLLNYTISTHL